jgi:uncharacterized membrane protein YfcA
MDILLFSALILTLTGIVIEFASGFFRVGGGFLMVMVRYWLLTSFGFGPMLSLRVASDTSLTVTLPTTLSSTWGHHCRHCVLLRPLTLMIVPGILGFFRGGNCPPHTREAQGLSLCCPYDRDGVPHDLHHREKRDQDCTAEAFIY